MLFGNNKVSKGESISGTKMLIIFMDRYTIHCCNRILIGKKRFKNILLIFDTNAQTIVLNTYPYRLVKLTDLNIDYRGMFGVFNFTQCMTGISKQT